MPVPAAEDHFDNRRRIDGLMQALGQVVRIELRDLNGEHRPETLGPADSARLLGKMRAGGVAPVRTLAHPPWPVIFVIHTKQRGTYAVRLVGHTNFRIYPDLRDKEGNVKWTSSDGELALADEENWVWDFLKQRFGQTRQQEYLIYTADPNEQR